MNNKGITIISLIVTIILMLILATVTINVTIGDRLFKTAGDSKLKTEIADLQTKIMKEKLKNDNKINDGTINEILKTDSAYNDKLTIEDGELVYYKDKWSETDIEVLEELGIYISSIDEQNITCAQNPTTYYIVDEPNVEKYGGTENIGSMWDLAEMKLAKNFKNSQGNAYTTTIMLEDVYLNCSEQKQWTPIELKSEIFDGQYHTVNGIYINSTAGYVGLFSTATDCDIKNLIIDQSYIYTTGQYAGGIAGIFRSTKRISTISNCINKAQVYAQNYARWYGWRHD